MLSKIKHFWLLPISHKTIFLKIITLVPLVELGVRTIGFKRVFNLLNRFPEKTSDATEKTKLFNKHGFHMHLFQRNFPYLGRCLARSLTAWFLLKKKGIETELKFGMKKENGELLAHAWIEYEGVPLRTDSTAHNEYVAFTDSVIQKSLNLK
jgi:hypothetical protein